MFVGTKRRQRETGHCPSLRRGRFVAIHAMRALHVRLAALPAKRPAARGRSDVVDVRDARDPYSPPLPIPGLMMDGFIREGFIMEGFMDGFIMDGFIIDEFMD